MEPFVLMYSPWFCSTVSEEAEPSMFRPFGLTVSVPAPMFCTVTDQFAACGYDGRVYESALPELNTISSPESVAAPL